MANRSDNFNRADSNTGLGTPSDGGAGWTTGAATLGITGNRAVYVSGGGGEGYGRLNAGSADVHLVATIYGPSFHGILFRFTDTANYHRVYRSNASTFIYQCFTGGVAVQNTGLGGLTIADGDTMEARVIGDSVEILHNGVVIHTVTEDDHNTATNHGIIFLNGTSSGTIDSITITDLGSSFSIDRAKVLTGSSGTVSLELTGVNTTWAGSPFSLSSPPTGWSINSQTVHSATSATVVLNKGTGTGVITVSDGAKTATTEATATATTIADGDPLDPDIWDVVEVPVTHAAINNHNLTLAANWNVPPLTNNGTVTGAGFDVTFKGNVTGAGDFSITSGDVTLDATAADVSFTVGAGGSLSIVGTDNANRNTLTKIGANDAWIDATDFFGSSLTLRYLDIPAGLADPTGTFAVKTSQDGAFEVLIEDCDVDGCPALPYQVATDATANYRVRRVRWTNIVGDYACNVKIACDDPADAGTCEFYRCSAPAAKPMLINKGIGLILDGCAEGITSAGVWTDAIIRNIFWRGITGGVNLVTFGFTGVAEYKDGFLMQDDPTTDGNPHFLSAGGTCVVDGMLFDYPKALGTTDFGDCILAANADMLTVKNCLGLPSETDGRCPGYLCTVGTSSPPKSFAATHNTMAGRTARVIFVKDPGYVSTGQTWATVKSNLAYVPDLTGGNSWIVYDLDVDNTPYDVVRGDGCSHNGLYLPGTYTDPSNGNAEYDGYQQRYATSGTPGANDVIADPQFVDHGRNFCKWAVHKGYAASGDTVQQKIDAGVAALLLDPSLVELDLIPWVRAGYAPQNPAYDAAAHDGTTIGAVAYNAGGTTVETAQTGDWNDTATWVGGAVPAAVDTAIVNHAVNVTANATIAGLEINAAISVAAGMTFTITGAVTQGNGKFSLGVGSKLVADTTGGSFSWIQGTANSQADCIIEAVGSANPGDPAIGVGPPTTTGGNHAVIEVTGGNRFHIDYNASVFHSGGLDLLFCDVIGLKNADLSVGYRQQNYGLQIMRVRNCVFDDYGPLVCAVLQDTSYGGVFQLNDSRWLNGASGAVPFINRVTRTATDPTSEVQRCVFDKPPTMFQSIRMTFKDNFLEGFIGINGSFDNAEFAWNFVLGKIDGTQTLGISADVIDNFFLHDHLVGNPHFVDSKPNKSYLRNLFEYPHPTGGTTGDAGDCLLGYSLETAIVEGNIALPSDSDGVTAGFLMNFGRNVTGSGLSSVNARHNTACGKQAMLAYCKDYAATGEVYQFNRSSIAYSPEGGLFKYASAVYDLFVDDAPYDVARGDGCTHNGIYNGIPYTDPSNGNANYVGYLQRFAASGTPGANDILTDPQFLDYGRNFVRWVVYKGAAPAEPAVAHTDPLWIAWLRDTLDAGYALLRAEPTLTRTDLIPWVFEGYAPTNPDYDAAAHDGGTIGAVPYQAAGGPLTSPTLVEVSKTSRTITFSWDEATGGTPPYNYDIEQEQPSGSGDWVEVESDVTSPAVVDLLDPNTTYNHRLKTTDSGV